jgi:hypothetical protein
MSHPATPHCAWRTATYGDGEIISKSDTQTLGEHLNACQNSRLHLFNLRCVAESMHGFVASRFITTLAILVSVAALAFWLI